MLTLRHVIQVRVVECLTSALMIDHAIVLQCDVMKVVPRGLEVIALVDLARWLAPARLLSPLVLHLSKIRKHCNLPFCEGPSDHTYHFLEGNTSSQILNSV